MTLKTFVINNSNKFFAKTHDYEELKAWMSKTSDKFFVASVSTWVLAVFVAVFLEKNSVFWTLLILGGLLYLLSGLFSYYTDFVKRVEPIVLKKSEASTWRKAYQNQKDIDVWIEVFTSMFDSSLLNSISHIKAGENYSCEDNADNHNFLLHVLKSYSTNKEMQSTISIWFEKDIDGEKVSFPFEFIDKLKYNRHFETQYKINVDETLEKLKKTMRLDNFYFGEIREEILSNSLFSVSKIEIGRQYVDYNVYGHNFQDVEYIIRVTIDLKANEKLQNSELIKLITTSAEKEYQQKEDIEKARNDMSEFKNSLL